MLRSRGSTERVPPLHGSDSSFENAPADLPLREDVPVDAPVSPAVRTFLGSTGTPDEPRPAVVRTWVAAAVALVIGIVIGFASGFTAADRLTPAVASAPEMPATSSTPGRPFSEGAVPPAEREPVRVEPEPIVAEKAEKEAAPAPKPAVQQAASPRPSPRTQPAPRAQPAPTEPEARVDGPGSLQVVSRPSGAQVILDGRDVGRTPLSLAAVPEGPHAVRLDLAGFKPWSTTVEVQPGQRMRVAASLEQ
jgi:hypothetical protein